MNMTLDKQNSPVSTTSFEPRYFNGIAKKGQIWNVQKGNTSATGTEMWSERPAIIVSNDSTNEKASFVNVVYLTTSPKREMPYHVSVKSGNKMATALCEQIFAVDKSRLSFYVGEISNEELLDIDKALLFSLGISNTLKPTTLYKKWANAINRYNIDMTGPITNTDDKFSIQDNSNCIVTDEATAKIIKERNMYRTLYESEKNKTQTLTQMMELSFTNN